MGRRRMALMALSKHDDCCDRKTCRRPHRTENPVIRNGHPEGVAVSACQSLTSKAVMARHLARAYMVGVAGVAIGVAPGDAAGVGPSSPGLTTNQTSLTS